MAIKALALGVVTMAFGLSQAHASFTVTLDSSTNNGNTTTFKYSASISDSDVVKTGDFFKIVDFPGLVAGSVTAPTGWVASSTAGVEGATQVSTAGVDAAPSLILSHSDDAAIPNLTFTYQGTSPISGSTSIGGFSAASIFGNSGATRNFYGVTNLSNGLNSSSVGDIVVPTIGLPSPAPAPEPSSVISGAIGAAIFGLAYARRRAQARRLAAS